MRHLCTKHRKPYGDYVYILAYILGLKTIGNTVNMMNVTLHTKPVSEAGTDSPVYVSALHTCGQTEEQLVNQANGWVDKGR